jgi:hypothetical protein
MDALVMLAIVASFATLVTVHVALCAALAARRPFWQAAVALAVPPLAPYWGFSEKLRVRAGLWCVAAALYVVTLLAARVLTP